VCVWVQTRAATFVANCVKDKLQEKSKWMRFLFLLSKWSGHIHIFILIYIPVTHSEKDPHLHTDISCRAHNDNNKRGLIYSQHGLNSTTQISPSMLLFCPTGFVRSPIRFPLQRTRQVLFMLQMNLQNKAGYDSFCTCSQHRREIKWAFDCITKQLLLLIMPGKKLHVLSILLYSWAVAEAEYLLDYWLSEEG